MTPDNRTPSKADSHRGDADESSLPALGWMRRARAEDELIAEVSRQLHRRRRRRFTAVSGLLSLVLVAGAVWQIRRQSPPPLTDTAGYLPPAFSTAPTGTAAVASPERRILPDGSVIELIEGARVSIDFSGPLRKVALEQGKAHFQVAKDAQRPFVVAAAGVHVRAVGTAFVVDRSPNRIEVLVTHGRVAVAADDAKTLADDGTATASEQPASAHLPPKGLAAEEHENPAVKLLDAGKAWSVDLTTSVAQVQTLSDAQMTERTSWRIPQLEFSRTPLPDALALLNQHNRVQFVIGDPALNTLKLSGFLRADNTEGMVRLLETNFSLKAERQGDVISLRR